jgi:Flp pilus assembly protein TadD
MIFFRSLRARNGLALSLAMLLGACGSSGAAPPDFAVTPPPNLPAGITEVHSPYGAYIAGVIAASQHDDTLALAYYQAALIENPSDATLASRVFVLSVLNGRFDIATPLAHRIVAVAPQEPLANLVLTIDALRDHRASEAISHAGRLPQDGFYRFAGAFARSWSAAAAWHGRTPDADEEQAALAALDGLGDDNGMAAIKALHKALIADQAGDAKTAETQYLIAITDSQLSFRIVQLTGNFLARHGKLAAARDLYTRFVTLEGDRFGIVPAAITANPAPLVATPTQGMAEALFDLASLVSQSASPQVGLLSTRLALALRPDFPYARVLLANALISEGRIDPALAVLQTIDPATPLGWTAALSSAQLLSDEGRQAKAETLLRRLVAARPQAPEPLVALGDVLRAEGHYADAAVIYTQALDRLGPQAAPAKRAQLLFSRGMCYEQTPGRWAAGEADLRQAIALDPQPAVQNYLGYALVVRNEKLPEAVRLIKAAITAHPNDGYYVDSLGWAYYHAGNFRQAAATLERAAELKPADSEINDHLGDAYWRSGRTDEARTAWRRALEFHPAPSRAGAIAAKLDRGPPATTQPF